MDTQDANMNSTCPKCSAPMIDGVCPVCGTGPAPEAGAPMNPTPAPQMPETPRE